MKTVVVWPSDNEVKRTESAFHEFAGFPGIIGATDGCHVPIVVPEAGCGLGLDVSVSRRS